MSKGTSAMVAWTFDNRSTDLSGTAELDQTRTHNAANEITDLSGTANDPTHDASGNMTADSSNTYIYDAWNRLVEVRDRGDDSLMAAYEYDGQKRRIEKTVNSSTDDYFYGGHGLRSLGGAGWQLLETRTAADADPSEQYIWDLRYVDAPVLRFQDTNTDGTVDNTLYYTNDANFNVTALVDESGTVVERYSYSPYGERTVLDGDWGTDADGVSDVANNILYCGYHFDAETTLYHVRNRMYNSELGRWIQRDPLGYIDGMHLCEYCVSTPIRYIDASGLLIIVAIDAGKASQNSTVLNPDRTEYHELGVRKIGYWTWEEAFKMRAKQWNELIDAAIKDAKNTQYSEFSIDGQVVDRDNYINRLEAARMEVRVLSKDTKKAGKELKKALADAGPNGEVLLETHGRMELWGMNSEEEGPQYPASVKLGDKWLSHDELAKLVGKSKEGQAATLVFGSCFWSEEQIKKLADDLNRQVSGSSGKSHSLKTDLETRAVAVEKDGKFAAYRLEATLKTLEDYQDFSVNPSNRAGKSVGAK
jgi:RHS repeat-associated protein